MSFKTWIVNSIFLFIIASSANGKDYDDVVVSEVINIYDGDTFKVTIDDWPALLGERISIRVNNIDTPEIKGKCKKEKILARKAKQHTVSMLRGGKVIELRNMKRGKYFRIIADVYIDGKNLAESLLNLKLAAPYDKSNKIKNWCD